VDEEGNRGWGGEGSGPIPVGMLLLLPFCLIFHGPSLEYSPLFKSVQTLVVMKMENAGMGHRRVRG
jgi:hypothetical protein